MGTQNWFESEAQKEEEQRRALAMALSKERFKPRNGQYPKIQGFADLAATVVDNYGAFKDRQRRGDVLDREGADVFGTRPAGRATTTTDTAPAPKPPSFGTKRVPTSSESPSDMPLIPGTVAGTRGSALSDALVLGQPGMDVPPVGGVEIPDIPADLGGVTAPRADVPIIEPKGLGAIDMKPVEQPAFGGKNLALADLMADPNEAPASFKPAAIAQALDPQAEQPARRGAQDPLVSSTAGRYGINPSALSAFVKIESGGNPNAKTGSYNGLLQLSEKEFAASGGQNIFDPAQNLDVGTRKLAGEAKAFEAKYGRPATAGDLYMTHQQGAGGYANHMANPDAPAWQNMLATGEGQQKGEKWARAAIWGNIPDQEKRRFGSVDNVTSKDFSNYWVGRVNGQAGSGPVLTASAQQGGPPQADIAQANDLLRPVMPMQRMASFSPTSALGGGAMGAPPQQPGMPQRPPQPVPQGAAQPMPPPVRSAQAFNMLSPNSVSDARMGGAPPPMPPQAAPVQQPPQNAAPQAPGQQGQRMAVDHYKNQMGMAERGYHEAKASGDRISQERYLNAYKDANEKYIAAAQPSLKPQTINGRLYLVDEKTGAVHDRTTGEMLKAEANTTGTKELDRAISDWELNGAKGPKPTIEGLKKSGAGNTVVNNTVNPILHGVGERYNKVAEHAQAAQTLIPSIHEARKALDGGAFTGLASEPQLFMAKAASVFGMSNDKIANTEVFRSAVGNQVLDKAKTLGANPTDTDRKYIQAIQGGEIKLDETSVRKIIDMQERWARESVNRANAMGTKLLEAQPGELSQIAPLLRFDQPPSYEDYIKSMPPAAAAAPVAPAAPSTDSGGWKIERVK